MIKPINKRLILQPSDSTIRGSIFIPETFKDAATTCLVIAAGSKVMPILKPGEIVMCEVGFGDRLNNTVEGTRSFWCEEHNIYGLLRDGKIHPIGNKILIRRDVEDKYEGMIVIPETRRSQSLLGTIERMGITRTPFKTIGLKAGLKIQLKEWSEAMTQVTLEDGGHGMIVNESDIICYYED